MKITQFLFFLVINFTALYIGSIFTDPMGQWYQSLNKAPWTPPGWVFGFMWTLIMVCLSLYMSYYSNTSKKWHKILIIYGLQILFNITWNPIYFKFHWQKVGFINLMILLLILMIMYRRTYTLNNTWIRFLLFPYIIWLCLAMSLNGFTMLFN